VRDVGLFIPCYVDQCYPGVGLATVKLLERLDCPVDFPEAQTCCGQPMGNAGSAEAARPLAERYLSIFERYRYVVCPSGSCTAMVRHHYQDLLPPSPALASVTKKTYELCEFIVDVLGVTRIAGGYPHRVGLHESCHALRELGLASPSEKVVPHVDKVRGLLSGLAGISFAELERKDECCGFGGVFSVEEEAVSCAMGKDRLADHLRAGADVIAGVDMSCLMHLQGLAARAKKPVRFAHVAEILAGAAS
jgi:L-lactate dehydrogenase complex protein LldE